jgi:hypothetical protein
MSHQTFEDYLAEKFMDDFHGTKDQYEAAFDRFLSQLDGEEYCFLANQYGELREMRAKKN